MNPQQPVSSILEQEKIPQGSYTVLGRFREIGKEIDPSRNWANYTKIGFYSKDEKFELISGSNKEKLISGIRDLNDPSRKVSFEHSFSNSDFSERVNENFINSLKIFSSEKKAQLFIDLNIELENYLKANPNTTPEIVDSFLVGQVLTRIPDRESGSSELDSDILIADFFESRESNLEKDNDNSQIILQKLLKQISNKFDHQTFKKFLDNYSDSNRFSVFDQQYQYSKIFKDFWSTPLLAQRENGFQNKIETIPYPTKNQITNQIETKEQLKQNLYDSPFEKFPEALAKSGSTYEEQVVDINSVVGMSGCDSWFIQDVPSSDKGLGNIWKHVQKFKNEDLHFTSESSFIKGINVNGKIWVSEDGRNRFAALKALGVKQIPMLIIEGQVSERTSVSSII